MVKKKEKEPQLWEDSPVEEVQKSVAKPKKKRSASYSKQKGSSYERKIVNELKEITGDEDFATARAESKSLDDAKIDIYDPHNTLPFYVQCKSTQVMPAVKKINSEVGKTDKSLAIFWNAQEKKATNICSVGEYAIITKEMLYKLLRSYLNDKDKL